MAKFVAAKILISSIFLTCFSSNVIGQEIATSDSFDFTESVPIHARSRQFTFTSSLLDHEIVVTVAAPPPGIGASSERSNDLKLPAVYALDNGYGVVGPITQNLSQFYAISPAFVVSIDNGIHRNTDLLYQEIVENGEAFGGSGESFQSFLTDYLKPFIEARYPIDPETSVLFGYSFGGNFTANLLARKPEAFSNYVIASPSVMREPDIIDRLASSIGRIGNKRVFLSVGGNEPLETIEGVSMIEKVLASEESEVDLESRIFDGEDHSSHYPLLVRDALRWLFPTTNRQASDSILLSPAELDRMAGEYRLSDDRIVTLGYEGDQIFIKMTGMPGQSPLLAESSDRFFILGFDVEFSLIMPIEGPATGLIVRADGIEMRAERED